MNTSRANSPFRTHNPIFGGIVGTVGVLATVLALSAPACKSSSATTAPATTEPAPNTAAPHTGRVDLSNDQEATAVVVAIDPGTRAVTLCREDGSLFGVRAGPAIHNFDQIAPGDRLRVRYHETLAASLRPQSEGTTPAEGAVVAGRAPRGATPAGGVAMAATLRVKIASVDKQNSIVVYSLDSGELRTVRAARPEGREFVQTLKVGDIVQLDYTASMALAIEKL